MNRAILMALLIAPLFTAVIAVGGIQNVYAPSQDWTVTLTNTKSGSFTTWTHAEFGDCTGGGARCLLPFSDPLLRKCVNNNFLGNMAIIFPLGSPATITCNAAWEVTLEFSGFSTPSARLVF